MKKKTLFIILGAVAGIGILYWLYKKGQTPAVAAAMGPAVDTSDDADLKKLVDVFKRVADPDAVAWLVPLAAENYANENFNDDSYLINGKHTKVGAFMDVFGSGYGPEVYNYKFKSGRDAGIKAMWDTWTKIKVSHVTI